MFLGTVKINVTLYLRLIYYALLLCQTIDNWVNINITILCCPMVIKYIIKCYYKPFTSRIIFLLIADPTKRRRLHFWLLNYGSAVFSLYVKKWVFYNLGEYNPHRVYNQSVTWKPFICISFICNWIHHCALALGLGTCRAIS